MASTQVQSLVAALIDKRAIYRWILDRSGGYNVATTIIDLINSKTGGSERVTSVDGKYEKYKRGKNNVVQQIASVTASGANVILTFSDPTYDKFLMKDVLMDTNYVLGRVIAAGPGTVTLQAYPDASGTLSASTTFQVGTLAKLMADISGTYGSFGVGNRIFPPYQTINYPSNTRASYTLTRADKIETYVDTKDGSPYYYYQNEMDMMMNYWKQIEFKTIFSQYGAPSNTSVEGSVTGNRGMRQGIMTDGVYMPLASAPTATNIQDMLASLANRNTASGQRFTCFLGRQALLNIQRNLTQPYIQYAGSRNTFGGEAVKGLNVMTYAIADVEVDFIILPVLNDSELSEPTAAANASGTKWSNSMYFLNLDNIPAVGGAANCPAIQKIHFGDEEILYRGINGMVGFAGDSVGSAKQGQYFTTSSDVDGASLQIESNSGIDGEWFRCGLIELTA